MKKTIALLLSTLVAVSTLSAQAVCIVRRQEPAAPVVRAVIDAGSEGLYAFSCDDGRMEVRLSPDGGSSFVPVSVETPRADSVRDLVSWRRFPGEDLVFFIARCEASDHLFALRKREGTALSLYDTVPLDGPSDGEIGEYRIFPEAGRNLTILLEKNGGIEYVRLGAYPESVRRYRIAENASLSRGAFSSRMEAGAFLIEAFLWIEADGAWRLESFVFRDGLATRGRDVAGDLIGPPTSTRVLAGGGETRICATGPWGLAIWRCLASDLVSDRRYEDGNAVTLPTFADREDVSQFLLWRAEDRIAVFHFGDETGEVPFDRSVGEPVFLAAGAGAYRILSFSGGGSEIGDIGAIEAGTYDVFGREMTTSSFGLLSPDESMIAAVLFDEFNPRSGALCVVATVDGPVLRCALLSNAGAGWESDDRWLGLAGFSAALPLTILPLFSDSGTACLLRNPEGLCLFDGDRLIRLSSDPEASFRFVGAGRDGDWHTVEGSDGRSLVLLRERGQR